MRSMSEESELRLGRRSVDFFGDSGSAKMLSSPFGTRALPGRPVAARRVRIASSCDRVGRCTGARGGIFSARAEFVTPLEAEYGGGGAGLIPLLVGLGLSLRVRLFYKSMINTTGG